VYMLTGARYDAADSLTHVEIGFTNLDSTAWVIRPHVTEASVITRMLSAGAEVYADLGHCAARVLLNDKGELEAVSPFDCAIDIADLRRF
jgi:hypothetical protein